MASREELLRSICQCTKVDNAFFLKVYGFEISYPGFADKAIKALIDAGCSRAREYYGKVVSEYERKQDEELKKVTAWYRQQCDKEWRQKEGETKRKQEQENLQQMSDSDWITLLENLIGVT